LAIALSGNRSVFELVILSWSTLACAFGPLLILHALGWRIAEPLAVAMLVIGIGVAWAWRFLGWHEMVYEGLPGMVAGLGVGLVGSAAARIRTTS
jgi:SSS family solute:Na+ symporter/sodium/proline symporter